MAILASIGAVLAAKCTFTYLTECIIDSSSSAALNSIPKLAERLRKQFRNTRPDVNHDLQKAILSSHWMATLVFVEQMHNKNLLIESYNNVNITIQNELKRLQEDTYLLDEISPDAYDAAKLIKLPKERDVITQLRTDILDYHSNQLNNKTGRVKELSDYQQLLYFIKNGWIEENLNWFSLMTAFLNQLLKGDNNNAKDAFQNQALADIQLKLEHFEQYAAVCVDGIGEERFKSFEKALFDEIAKMRNSLSGLHQKQDKTFKVVSSIESSVQRIENRLGESRQLDLNVFEQYRKLASDIDALRIEIASIEVEKKETLEFLEGEDNERKRKHFEKTYKNLEEEQRDIGFALENKKNELTEFETNIQQLWIKLYTNNSPRHLEARKAFEKGDLNKTNEILDENILQSELEFIEKLDAILLEKKESLANEYITKAELTVIQKLTVDWFDKADHFYETAIKLNPSSYIYSHFAIFLWNHNQFNRALEYYKTSLLYCLASEDKAITINIIGILHEKRNKFIEAEKCYQEVLEIRRELALKNSQKFLPMLGMILYNIGGLKLDRNEFDSAEKDFNECLNIERTLAKSKPESHLANVALILRSLGILGIRKSQWRTAKKRFRNALRIYRKLSLENRKEYLPKIADVLSNLGDLYDKKNETPKAVESYTHALKIMRKLSQENPQEFIFDVSKILIKLGLIHQNTNEIETSRQNLLDAYEIRKKLVEEEPQRFLPAFAELLNSLGNLQLINDDLDNAEVNYQKAAEIYRKLSKKDPEVFLPYFAKTFGNLGTLKVRNGKLNETEEISKKVLKAFRKLALLNPHKFLPETAKALNNLGLLYYKLERLEKSEKYLNLALRIRKKLALQDRQTYIPDIAKNLNNLGLLQRTTNSKLLLAEKNFLESLNLRKSLAKENPNKFSLDYANIAQSLALFYRYDLKNKAKSIQYARIAIQYSSTFSATVSYSAMLQKEAEAILKEWEDDNDPTRSL